MLRAKYTVVLKNLMEDSEVKPLLNQAMNTYPLYKPIHEQIYGFIPTREELNKKILNRYKYREIGFETIGRFLDELETSLNEIMPYYNQLYKSIDVMNGIDDIFGNLDVVESFEQTSEGTSKDSSEGKTKDSSTGSSKASSETGSESNTNSESETNSNINAYNKNVKSTMPQDDISKSNKDINGVSFADEINWTHNTSNDSATNKGKDTTSSSSESKSSGETSQLSNGETSNLTLGERFDKLKHTLSRKGNQGVNTYAHDMLEFRELFINIEQEIINDKRISELFMGIY